MDALWVTIANILALAALLLLRDMRDGKHIFKKNGNSSGVDAYNLMKYLKEHYNDTLSEDIRNLHGKQDEQLNLMKEWDKFGIPVRDCESVLKK